MNKKNFKPNTNDKAHPDLEGLLATLKQKTVPLHQALTAALALTTLGHQHREVLVELEKSCENIKNFTFTAALKARKLDDALMLQLKCTGFKSYQESVTRFLKEISQQRRAADKTPRPYLTQYQARLSDVKFTLRKFLANLPQELSPAELPSAGRTEERLMG